MAHTVHRHTYTSLRTAGLSRFLGGAVLVAALTLSGGVAHAAEDGGTTGSAAKQARLEKVCAKVPTLQTKVDAGITRLQGDTTVKGSIASLQAKLDKANAAGRTQAAAVLENRLQVRTQTLALLQTKQQRLTQIAETCAAQGLGA